MEFETWFKNWTKKEKLMSLVKEHTLCGHGGVVYVCQSNAVGARFSSEDKKFMRSDDFISALRKKYPLLEIKREIEKGVNRIWVSLLN